MNNPRTFSLAFLSISDIGPVEAVEVAAMAGYQMVGIRLLPATPDERPYPLLSNDKLMREVASALADTGVRIGDVELIRLKADTDVHSFCAFFERVQLLHARHIIVVSDDTHQARLIDRFSRLCELASTFGLTINLEPMPWAGVRDLADATEVVLASGQKNAGVLVDALHFHRRATPLECLENIPLELLNIFQICDAPINFDPSPEVIRDMARTARMIPGEGELDLQNLILRMPESAIVSIEVPSQTLMREHSPYERAQRALEFTKAIYSQISPQGN